MLQNIGKYYGCSFMTMNQPQISIHYTIIMIFHTIMMFGENIIALWIVKIIFIQNNRVSELKEAFSYILYVNIVNTSSSDVFIWHSFYVPRTSRIFRIS